MIKKLVKTIKEKFRAAWKEAERKAELEYWAKQTYDFSMLPFVENPAEKLPIGEPIKHDEIIKYLAERGIFLDGFPVYSAWRNKDGSLRLYIDGDVIIT